MANKFFQPGVERSVRVQQLFDRISPHYDLINDLQSLGLHRIWKRRLVRLTGLQNGTALDVCCGTGDIALAAEAAGGLVVALDFSHRMLLLAQERMSRREGGARIQLVRGDAERLPFRDDSFDAVTMGYGLRNLADWRRGAGEIYRVLKPGGTLAILEFSTPANPLWRAAYFLYLKTVVPMYGKIFADDWAAYSYILESLLHFSGADAVAEWLKAAGAERVAVTRLLGGVMSINIAVKR